ncbi:MAG: HIT domain-containing protein [Oscillospiraceae bacterium]|nr:HIT domain-containing protein [Oscillospiraceae bacterium]
MDKVLFRIAHMKFTGRLIGLALAYFPFIVPVKKILMNKNDISFFHPAPSYPDHVLIVPRKVVKNLFMLSADDFRFVVDMAIQIRQNNRQAYALLINGGDRQDIMQAHFHLFSDNIALQKIFF